MAMTLRLSDDEQAALRERAEVEGISMPEGRGGPYATTSSAALTGIGCRRPARLIGRHRHRIAPA
jgi:hypothetical protein